MRATDVTMASKKAVVSGDGNMGQGGATAPCADGGMVHVTAGLRARNRGILTAATAEKMKSNAILSWPPLPRHGLLLRPSGAGADRAVDREGLGQVRLQEGVLPPEELDEKMAWPTSRALGPSGPC